MRHSLTIIETAIASQALMGMILPQTSLKHKNHNEPSTKQYIKKEKINMQTHVRMKIFHKSKRQIAFKLL
ncbi:hypothetical protein [Helicobacter pylori]|uniref:hypothetical protein n=1 Tax=Helicobacter pylori TaxID=210 RepID=UPI0013E2951D|nr:hypothetical protein [Helicobacter pylori]